MCREDNFDHDLGKWWQCKTTFCPYQIALTLLKKYVNFGLCKHYFNWWLSFLEIRKVLSKLSKEKGCQGLADSIKPCENHLYWSASTTFSGNGKVIWAKFKAFMSHIINRYSSLDDPLFNRCGHGEIRQRKWLRAGMLHPTGKQSLSCKPCNFRKLICLEIVMNSGHVILVPDT